MTGCETCDTHGPELPSIAADGITLHRALHDFWRALTEPLEPVVRLLDRALTRP